MSTTQAIASQSSSLLNVLQSAGRPAATPAPRREVGETAQQERQEALSGKQEIGEGAGGRVNLTA